MPINKAGLKKLRVKELKALIRKYNIERLGGSKSELVDRVRNSNKYNVIKFVESVPKRTRKYLVKNNYKHNDYLRKE